MSGAPICSGIEVVRPVPTPNGATNRKIITVPWIVNEVL